MKFKIRNAKLPESHAALAAGNGCRRADGDGDGGRRKVVVVGVKLEQQSSELLTWALMKIAQPGDRVIALHILRASSQEQSSLVSLVKTFNSVLAVYEGFCHLKQVDLKLKVSRGSSVRKTLIQEAKQYDGATLVVGTSKNHTIRSPATIAKHCARKLSHDFSVFAIDNGKIVFERKATSLESGICIKSCCSISRSGEGNLARGDMTAVVNEVGSDSEITPGSEELVSGPRRSTLIKRYFACAPSSFWADYTCKLEESCSDTSSNSSLALVPYQTPEPTSEEKLGKEKLLPEHNNQRWGLIHRVFIRKEQHSDTVTNQKHSVDRHLSRLRTQHSAVAIHPDKIQVQSADRDDQLSDVGGENGVIVPVAVCASSPPSSPIHELNGFAEELKNFHAKYSSTCRLFTYQELQSATSGFLPERIIGKGGNSCVFKGQLPDGKELAVKILKGSENALKEFVSEIEIITSISHKNIISLIGFCFEDQFPILVYDLLPRGSLEENLHGHNKDVTAFSWEERYKVALGVAEALDYLHNTSSQPVIHRDVKSSNILLAEDFEPQLADFGLATWVSGATPFTELTDVAGTFGYLAPEYVMNGKATEKIDVYAFGVVILELLSGRKPIDHKNPTGKWSLVLWATPFLKDGKISDLLDPSLGSDYDHDLVERMALAATLCIRREPLFRPAISIILKLLGGDPDATKWARQQVTCIINSDFDALDGGASPKDIQSHLSIAFFDLEDDLFSVSSSEPNTPLADYLKGRWSRSPSLETAC